MTLKIVGRTPRTITEDRQKPYQARGATLHCDACGQDLHVAFPYGTDARQRQRLLSDAVDQHRKVGCTVGTAEDGRSFKIWYPRCGW